jgi:hypothetical protein
MSCEAHHQAMAPSPLKAITIRPAHIGDDRALAELVVLDSAEQTPSAPLLIGEVDGRVRAALSLADGSVVADPFFPTSDLLELMRAHAAHAAPRHRTLPRLRPRLAA